MREKEIIRLDARVVGVIADAVFRAELANGHQLVAFAAGPDKEKVRGWGEGAAIRVDLSPFDMSKGRIVFEK